MRNRKKSEPRKKRRPQNGPQTIDGTTGNVLRPPPSVTTGVRRRIDLTTLKDVRAELAAVYRRMDAGELATQDGTRRAYVLKTIGEIITMADFERRLEELEAGRFGNNGTAPAIAHRTH